MGIQTIDVQAIAKTGQDQTHEALEVAAAVVVFDAASYQVADLALFKVRSARKQIAQVIEDRVDSIIKPIRAGLDKLYEARRELLNRLDMPLEQAEKRIKGKMAEWQLTEKRRVEEEERKRKAEADRLRREQEEAERRAAEARTKAEREKQQARAAELQRQAQVKEVLVSKPVQAAGSSVRSAKVWEIEDMSQLIAAVVAGEVPEIVLQVNEEVMNEYWRQDRGMVSAWPGITVREKMTIAGR